MESGASSAAGKSIAVILGNPGVYHPEELQLRGRISDRDELNREIASLYSNIKKSARWGELAVDLQARALQAGCLRASTLEARSDVRGRIYVILLDTPRGLQDKDLMDQEKYKSGTRSTSKKNLPPTLDLFKEPLRAPFSEAFRVFGLQNAAAEPPNLEDIFVITKIRASEFLRKMASGKATYPNLKQNLEKGKVIFDNTVLCSGVFASALWIANSTLTATFPGLEPEVCAFWETGPRVRASDVQKGTIFAKTVLGVNAKSTIIIVTTMVLS